MIDLRSDTLTLPSKEMLATIATAQLGDDGRTHDFGRGEDLTVNKLEDLAAQITGKEAGVLFPTGTMGNSAAVLAFCQPGDKVLVDEQQHMYLSEKVLFDKSFGQLEAIKYQHNEKGIPSLADIEKQLNENDIKLLCIENTHNFSGGACIPPEHMKAIYELAHQHHVPVFMDGARMFNAAVSMEVEPHKLCSYVDAVMFCISKGLGAPVGSLVCGSQDFILKVRSKRKMLGGSMRQAGIIAAPGIYALEHNVTRLKEDHENAKHAASLLTGLTNTHIIGAVDSNILVLDVNDLGLTPQEYCQKAQEHGLLIKPVLKDKIRLVFYKGITKEDATAAAKIICDLDRYNK
ncbi:MAG TPA: aminotransferase class I/II-fold pyridoxal phosphate-dependent enzyme [Candidatus Dorea intestinavium]|nr:aminotransferase class I/II-fold pyridoxal phosphate-dependent enzyme [Candidatus Dorea intestinavium]